MGHNLAAAQPPWPLPPPQPLSRPEVLPDVKQDSDEENKKAPKVKQPRKGNNGFDNPKLYFFDGFQDNNQDTGSLTYKCRWCPNSVRFPASTNSNLKTHRDGSKTNRGIRKACIGRAKALAKGGNFPPSADDQAAATKKHNSLAGTLATYVLKGRFNIKTMNKLLLL
ncbi:hypothetical protein PTTG_26686 [Puccinia triticina 1-1 BBBD Race 1]|uniref:Uncharacterized protein n=1 Tax=Puccinia triticina (isolate 1-1 / race 1 (BBBD)) TaxID=630390 RepID=A0A180GR04_PUCT1|nr:hypothetical protein PTTG_26686 [Puccinia triticina 1-1 BBBD Race 1]